MTPHLILADANPTVQQVVELCFNEEPVEVHCFSDGNEALDYLRVQSGDILLADVSLPGLDGYSLCKRVKEDPRTAHLPVILLAGALVGLDEHRAERSGSHCVLRKPLDTGQLVELISTILSAPAESDPGSKPWAAGQSLELQLPVSLSEGFREELFQLAFPESVSPPPVYRCKVLPGEDEAMMEESPEKQDMGLGRLADSFLQELTGRLQAELPRLVSDAAGSVRQGQKS